MYFSERPWVSEVRVDFTVAGEKSTVHTAIYDGLTISRTTTTH